MQSDLPRRWIERLDLLTILVAIVTSRARDESVVFQRGLRPAERMKSTLMEFRTNYRDLDLAKTQAGTLEKIRQFGS